VFTETRRRTRTAATVAASCAAIALAAGCGSDASRPATRPSAPAAPTARPAKAALPPPLGRCRSAGGGWQALPTASGSYQPSAGRLGDGGFGVVFANDSVNDTCAWSSEARSLAGRGYTVAVFETVGPSDYEADQVLAVVHALRRAGVRRIVLIGASVGARAVLLAGARHPRRIVGLVALSAERRLGTSPGDLLFVGRQVRVPVLSIGSREDGLTSFGADTRAWHRTIRDDRALILSGEDHGVDLLTGSHGPRVRAAILAFLRAVKGSADHGTDNGRNR
jgi:dienelactone hydrolase